MASTMWAGLIVLGMSGSGQGVTATDSGPSNEVEPAIQMLADLTLIDGQCRGMTVIFGQAFRAGEAKGLSATDIMPTGPLRERFEAAYLRRYRETTQAELCGELADRYSAEIPGVLTRP